MPRWWTRHWFPWPWADALAKRLLELALAFGGLLLVAWWLQRTVPAGSHLSDVSSRPHVLLIPVLAALFFMVRALFRVVVHPLRAAFTGRFLDEQARSGMPAYRGVFAPGITEAKPTLHDENS